jgi:hypothetical protein
MMCKASLAGAQVKSLTSKAKRVSKNCRQTATTELEILRKDLGPLHTVSLFQL